jgi:hypothetical protein
MRVFPFSFSPLLSPLSSSERRDKRCDVWSPLWKNLHARLLVDREVGRVYLHALCAVDCSCRESVFLENVGKLTERDAPMELFHGAVFWVAHRRFMLTFRTQNI